MYTYYTKARPAMLGAIPDGAVMITHNVSGREFVEDAGCCCWSKIEYMEPLTPAQIDQYELAEGGMLPFWRLRYAHLGAGLATVKAYSLTKVYAKKAPRNTTTMRGKQYIETVYNIYEDELREFIDRHFSSARQL